MAQWLKALDALPAKADSVSGTHSTAHNHLQFKGIELLLWPLCALQAHSAQINKQAQHP